MQKIKKFTAVFLALLMIISVAPFTGLNLALKASALEASGQLTDTICYTFDEVTGTLTISGTGDMPNYNYYESPFYEDDSIKSVIIEYGVTSISDYAFDNCDSLVSVEVPDSVTNIGDWAFECCDSLANIEIPDSVASIGEGAFYRCENLIRAKISDSVTSFGAETFEICTRLKSITIPASVTSIGDMAFGECESLTDVFYAGTEEQWNEIEIGFSNGNLLNANIHFNAPDIIDLEDEKIYLNDTVYYTFDEATGTLTISGEGAMPNYDWDGSPFYEDDSIKAVIIEDGVTSIGDNVFAWCYNLESIEIPDSVTSIGDAAFHFCDSLTSITIPDSVTSIGYGTFEDCDSLTSITIPNSVTSIGDFAFESCDSLTSITIPDSVTSIGESAFDYCYRLTDVYYSGTEEQWNAIEIEYGNDDLLNANIHFHEHSYISEITTAATCAADGVMTYTCSCGYTYTEAIPATGHHTLGGWYVAVEPTKTVSGVLRRECRNCDYCEEMDMGFAEVDKVKGISLSSNSETLVPGGSVNLEAIITPETADNKNVFWTSSDDTVASVLNGTVIANNIGSAVIIAETEDGGYKDFCLIKVAGITAANSSAVIDNENNLIYGLAPNLASIEEYVELTDEAATFEYNSAVLGTGTVVNIVKNDTVVDSYEVVIFGDVNNDSWYDGTDSVIVNCLANGILSEAQVGEAAYTAADCNHDGVIDGADVALLEQAGLILANVDQSKTPSELFEDAAFCEYINLIDQSPVTAAKTVEEAIDTTPVNEPVVTKTLIQKIIDFIIYIVNLMKTFIAKF